MKPKPRHGVRWQDNGWLGGESYRVVCKLVLLLSYITIPSVYWMHWIVGEVLIQDKQIGWLEPTPWAGRTLLPPARNCGCRMGLPYPKVFHVDHQGLIDLVNHNTHITRRLSRWVLLVPQFDLSQVLHTPPRGQHAIANHANWLENSEGCEILSSKGREILPDQLPESLTSITYMQKLVMIKCLGIGDV